MCQVFGFVAIAQPHFKFTGNTGNNATVGVLLNAPSIAGAPLVAGDEIGAFTPAGLCVGAAVWDGIANVALTLWQDDNQTVLIDGIKTGELIRYRIWRQSSNAEISNPSVTYSLDPSGNGTYVTDGIYTVSSMTVSAGAATKYLVTSGSPNPVAGSVVTITAQLADANSSPLATSGKTVTWSKTGSGGSFGLPTSTTDAIGRATVTFTTGTTTGTVYAVTATDNASLTGTCANFTTVAGPGAKYVVTASRYAPAAGDTVSIRAQLADAYNNPVTVAGKTVTWSKTGSGGSFASPTSATDGNGIATVVLTTGPVAGTVQTVTATDNAALTGTSANIISPPKVARGDVDGNGQIQAADASFVLKFVAGLATSPVDFTNSAVLSAADASNNGSITAYDAALILQAAGGLTTLPASMF